MFGKNKGLDLSLGDSDYSPAINPNTLAPQPSTGTKQQQKPSPQLQQPKLQKQRQQQRIISDSKPPTIINNYYYVQPSSPLPPQVQSPPPVIDPRYSIKKDANYHNHHRSQQQQQQQQQQQPQQKQHSMSQKPNYQLNQSQQRQYANDQRRSSNHSDYDSFVNSAKSKYSNRSGSTSPLKSGNNGQLSIYDSVSLFSSDSTRRPTNDNLYLKSKMEAKLPNIEYDDDDGDISRSRGSGNDRINLINVLSKMDDNDISVHNEKLYEIFHNLSNREDLLNFNTLADILCDPFEPVGRLPFASKSVELIINTFTSSHIMNFRNFIKLAKFSNGCLISFMFHDKKRRHLLSFNEFTKALQSNSMVCPDELLAHLFEKSEDLDFEGYIVGIISIRSWERKGTR